MTRRQFRTHVGLEIRRIRQRKGISQRQLGEMIGAKQHDISKLESGERSISLEKMTEVLAALNRKMVLRFENINDGSK